MLQEGSDTTEQVSLCRWSFKVEEACKTILYEVKEAFAALRHDIDIRRIQTRFTTDSST